uniref:Putative secreted protein n=1 Tax=Panstrongylus lignarius TaxID=156445 RepID=A0A224Y347_9HEMI
MITILDLSRYHLIAKFQFLLQLRIIVAARLACYIYATRISFSLSPVAASFLSDGACSPLNTLPKVHVDIYPFLVTPTYLPL